MNNPRNPGRLQRFTWLVGLALSLVGGAAMAQSSAAAATAPAAAASASAGTVDGFPAGARALEPADLQARLKDQRFEAKLADGTGWRIMFQGGYMYIDVSNGARDNGPWRAENSRLCVDYRGRFPSGCNEVRDLDGNLVLRRGNGEIVRLMPKS